MDSVDNVLIGPYAGYNAENCRVVTAVGRTCGANMLYCVSNVAYGEDAIGVWGSLPTPPTNRSATVMFAQTAAPAASQPLLRDPRTPAEVGALTAPVDTNITNPLITGDSTSVVAYEAYQLDRSRVLAVDAHGNTSMQLPPYQQTTWGMNAAFGGNCLEKLEVYSQFNTGCGGEAGGELQWGDNNTLVGMLAAHDANMMRCNTVVGTSAATHMSRFNPATDTDRFPVPTPAAPKRIDYIDITDETGYNTVVGCRAADRVTLSTGAYTRAAPEYSLMNVRNSVLIGHGVCDAYVHSGANNTFRGPYNTIVGSHAAPLITTGNSNVIQGFYTAPVLTTGSNNVILGSTTAEWALAADPFGDYAPALRPVFDPLTNPTLTLATAPALTTGSSNIILGKGAGVGLTTGSDNIAIGRASTVAAATANHIAIGTSASATGTDSISIGSVAATTGVNSISIGNATTAAGLESVAIGLGTVATNQECIAIGHIATADALDPAGSQQDAIAIGGDSHCHSGNSIALGGSAMVEISSDYSTALGSYATVETLSDRGIAIGNNAHVASTHTDAIAIGYNALTPNSNTMQIGSNGTRIRVCETGLAHTYYYTIADMGVANPAAVFTAADMLGGIIIGTPGGAASLTTPTAAQILATVLIGATTGQGFCLKIVNLSAAGAYTLTAVDASVTIVGNPVIALSSSANLIVRMTGAATVSIYI
jgi:hypothetical protein